MPKLGDGLFGLKVDTSNGDDDDDDGDGDDDGGDGDDDGDGDGGGGDDDDGGDHGDDVDDDDGEDNGDGDRDDGRELVMWRLSQTRSGFAVSHASEMVAKHCERDLRRGLSNLCIYQSAD